MSVEEDAVSRLVRRPEAIGIPYMVAGSVASSLHGLPRATNDADVVIDPTPPALEALLAALPVDGYYVAATIAREALRDRRLFTERFLIGDIVNGFRCSRRRATLRDFPGFKTMKTPFAGGT